MNKFSSVIAFLFVLISVASAIDFSSNDLVEDDPRTIYSANGGLYLSLNSTLLVYGIIALGVLIAVGYAVFLFTAVPPAYERNTNYYDPDLTAANAATADAALAYAQSAQAQQQEYRKRRSVAHDYNMAAKMHQLNTAFKKYDEQR